MRYGEKILTFKINRFELVAANSPYYGENFWHQPINGLTNNPRISYLAGMDVFQLYLCQDDEKVG